MALKQVFAGVVKSPDRDCADPRPAADSPLVHKLQTCRRRRGGAGCTVILPPFRLISAPARVCLGL